MSTWVPPPPDPGSPPTPPPPQPVPAAIPNNSELPSAPLDDDDESDL